MGKKPGPLHPVFTGITLIRIERISGTLIFVGREDGTGAQQIDLNVLSQNHAVLPVISERGELTVKDEAVGSSQHVIMFTGPPMMGIHFAHFTGSMKMDDGAEVPGMTERNFPRFRIPSPGSQVQLKGEFGLQLPVDRVSFPSVGGTPIPLVHRPRPSRPRV